MTWANIFNLNFSAHIQWQGEYLPICYVIFQGKSVKTYPGHCTYILITFLYPPLNRQNLIASWHIWLINNHNLFLLFTSPPPPPDVADISGQISSAEEAAEDAREKQAAAEAMRDDALAQSELARSQADEEIARIQEERETLQAGMVGGGGELTWTVVSSFFFLFSKLHHVIFAPRGCSAVDEFGLFFFIHTFCARMRCISQKLSQQVFGGFFFFLFIKYNFHSSSPPPLGRSIRAVPSRAATAS